MHPALTFRGRPRGAAGDRGGIAVAFALMAAIVTMPLLVVFLIALAAAGHHADACTGDASASAPSQTAHNGIPANYLTLYRAAAARYGIQWNVLAAIGEVETDHGRSNLPGVHSGTNYAGAEGPMQFEPATWATYGVDGDGDGRKDVYDPADAIYGAANYLKASGAPQDLQKAIWAYNQSSAYYTTVMSWAHKYAAGGYTATSNNITGTTACTEAGNSTNASPNGPLGARIVYYAGHYHGKSIIGWPYQWAGGDENGPTYGSAAEGTHNLSFDCSGLTLYAVYQATGGKIDLPHFVPDQWDSPHIHHITRGQLQAGDLVFFTGSDGSFSRPGHVGIYAGKQNGHDTMIAAPQTGEDIGYKDISTTYYTSTFVGAGRVIE